MDSEKVIKRDNEYVLHTYARNPIVLEKGHGLCAEGPEGQKYSAAASASASLGHGYDPGPRLSPAGTQAAAHLQPLLYHRPCGKLAKLTASAPA